VKITETQQRIAAILHKLDHAANSEFSAVISPEDCEFFLYVLKAVILPNEDWGKLN